MNSLTFVNIDTSEEVSKYIDQICSDPNFLCKNKNLCGTNTSIYTSESNVNEICNAIDQANICETDFQECVVLANNLLEGGQKYISTSFVNIIIPIPNALDNNGNNKFLRLPALSSSKKPNSMEICSICACMNRFATSPGAGLNDYTSPGQNSCVYMDNFEYFYYPLQLENINKRLNNPPPIILGKYLIINSNIITANTEEDLTPINLYNLLISNGISDGLSRNFITKTLYKNQIISKELQLYLLNKGGS
jgi:hypothetical protein